jgi:hypothetical protein
MLEAQHERRRMQRCEVEEPVTVKFWDHGPREITATVQNASPDGIFFQTSRALPQHSQLELVFLFPATLRSPGVRFVCKCRLVRTVKPVSGKFGVGVAILRSESERLTVGSMQPEGILEPVGTVLAD